LWIQNSVDVFFLSISLWIVFQIFLQKNVSHHKRRIPMLILLSSIFASNCEKIKTFDTNNNSCLRNSFACVKLSSNMQKWAISSNYFPYFEYEQINYSTFIGVLMTHYLFACLPKTISSFLVSSSKLCCHLQLTRIKNVLQWLIYKCQYNWRF